MHIKIYVKKNKNKCTPFIMQNEELVIKTVEKEDTNSVAKFRNLAKK